ncbi:hypothetical protein ACERIT_12310 [Halopenitus sp. H-Gu1]|uniref:hypothetical protein n=1 Tax=Halopenitus sp. H-Gu1 TaxID=3242697 RepID=UPI00359DAF7A
MASNQRVVGASENVDAGAAARERQPYEMNVDERRVIVCYCCTCEESKTMLMEVGDSSPWEHDAKNPAHVVEYWREDDAE